MGDEMKEQLQAMIDAQKKYAAMNAVTHIVDSLVAFAEGRFADAINHNRAMRAYAGAATGQDLLTKNEHRTYKAHRLILTLADQPCSEFVEAQLVELAWGVLRVGDGEVIARAEMLRDYVEVAEYKDGHLHAIARPVPE